MRYSVMSRTLPIQEVEGKCRRVGATHIKTRPLVKQVFCELSKEAAQKLAREYGVKLSPIKTVGPSSLLIAPAPAAAPAATTGLNLFTIYSELRQAYSPPLIGLGLTVAVLDSGIRTTHEALNGKVILEENFSEAPTVRDVFGHGTGTSYIVAGEHVGKSGVAPGAKIMSMKVLNDNGLGTDEMVVDAIERVCELVQEAVDNNLPMTDEMYPNTINLSVGSEDDGDPDAPMRVACQVAVEDYGVQIIAAAGNSGPDMTTILSPATDPLVIAVGGLKTWEFIVWDRSSRGPTLEGVVKPDLVCWAEDIEIASHRADDEYEVKTGTSFSTPMLVGVDGLLWDLTRRVYGPDVRVTYYDWLPYAYAYCGKPEGVQLAKDNSYGYGIPAMGSMINQLMRPVSPVSGLLEMMPVIMMLGMMPGMMVGI